MSRVPFLLAALGGAVVGYLASTLVREPVEQGGHRVAPPTTGPHPILDTTVGIERENAFLRAAIKEREQQVVNLARRVEELERGTPGAHPTSQGVPTFEASKERRLAHLLTDPAVSRDDLELRARAALGNTGEFQQYVVALHDADVQGYLEGVWAARREGMMRLGITLSDSDNAAVKAAFQARWLEFRRWMRSEHAAALGAAQSMADIQAAEVDAAMQFSLILNKINQDARRALKERAADDALFERVAPYL